MSSPSIIYKYHVKHTDINNNKLGKSTSKKFRHVSLVVIDIAVEYLTRITTQSLSQYALHQSRCTAIHTMEQARKAYCLGPTEITQSEY